MAETESTLIGERMRRYRKERGLTLKQLADLLQMHFTTVGKMENGKINFTYEKLADVAQALNVNMNWLTGDQYTDLGVIDIPVYADVVSNDERHPSEYARETSRLPILSKMERDLSVCYAILAGEMGVIDQLRFGHWFMAIDPTVKKIASHGLYAIGRPETDMISFATFELPTATIWHWPLGQSESLGLRPFTIIGEVFYQARPVAGPTEDDLDYYGIRKAMFEDAYSKNS